MALLRVMIVVDVRLYREGLASALATRDHLSVVAVSANRTDSRAQLGAAQPNVVIVDVAISESLDLIRDVRRDAPAAKILAFAVEEVTSDVIDCAEAGATGYVGADASIDDLVSAIERIAQEELVCSPRIAAGLFRRISERADPVAAQKPSHLKALTSREHEVLRCIRLGQSNKEIARVLNIAEPTVKNHVHHLLEKLEVTTRAQAAARASLPVRSRRIG
jgi:two-component system, NarL family, nitrate/nitrite response regulator NarL